MGESAVSKSITMANEPEEEIKTNTSFPDAVREIGKAIHEKYPLRNSNLTQENIIGMVEADAINEYMEKNFGVRYDVLDKLCEMRAQRNPSVKGWGTDKFIEALKGISATFEQTELPARLNQMINGRR